MKKQFLLASCALVALSVAAIAADLPVRTNAAAPSLATNSNWVGWYGGINGGWTHVATNWIHGTTGLNEGTAIANSGAIGAQFGYNFAIANRWLLGGEVQMNWLPSKGSKTIAPNYDWKFRTEANYLATASARLGYDYGASMSFVKLGLAATHHRYYDDELAGNNDEQGKANRLGMIAGLGYEFAINKNWSVGVEYNHVFMQRQSIHQYLVSTGAFSTNKNIKQDIDSVMLRLNYHFTMK